MNRTTRLLVGAVIAAGLVLASYPSLRGIADVIQVLREEGLTPAQIGRTLAYATRPRHVRNIARWSTST